MFDPARNFISLRETNKYTAQEQVTKTQKPCQISLLLPEKVSLTTPPYCRSPLTLPMNSLFKANDCSKGTSVTLGHMPEPVTFPRPVTADSTSPAGWRCVL